MQLPHKRTAYSGAAICTQEVPSINSLMQFEQDTFSSATEFNPYNLHASVH